MYGLYHEPPLNDSLLSWATYLGQTQQVKSLLQIYKIVIIMLIIHTLSSSHIPLVL